LPLFRFESNPSFVGRQDLLASLEEKLFSQDGTSKIAIFGLGGVGKTQLVIQLAHQTRKKYQNCSVIWIPAANKETLQQAYP
jgi:GTPase SAR1 family protein